MTTTMPLMITVMTPFPKSIDYSATINDAQNLMDSNGINHLPVTMNGNIESIISKQELSRAKLIGHRIESYEELLIGDISHTPASFTDINDPLDKVLINMAEQHIKAIIIMKEGESVGIFTNHDAYLALAQLLQEKYPVPDDDNAA